MLAGLTTAGYAGCGKGFQHKVPGFLEVVVIGHEVWHFLGHDPRKHAHGKYADSDTSHHPTQS